MKRVLLTDNGSLEAASTRQLRRIAAELAERLGVRVEPVSVAHSTKVPAEELDGRPAELLDAALERAGREGVTELVVAPLFIGPSYAVVRHMPALVLEKTKATAGLRATVAAPLFAGEDARLAEILAEHVREAIQTDDTEVVPPSAKWRVAVVDHGSPSRAVTAVREAVTAQLRERLGGAVSDVAACSMERREGAEYDFNEPLLARLLEREGWRDGPVIVALLFIGPGKHAGPGGDVAQIVAAARSAEAPAVKFTRLLGEHPRLIEILAERVGAAWPT